MSTVKSLYDKKIFDRLKFIRKSAGLSQAEFAECIGIKQSSYNEIETGKREPSPPIVATISYRFSINEDWIKSGEGQMDDGEGRAALGCYQHPNLKIQKIVEMLETMDENTQEDILLSVEKEKLLRDLLQEKRDKKAG